MTAFAERTEWPDSRISDLAQDVRELRGMPERVATLAERMEGFREDVGAIGDLFRKLEGRVEQALDEFADAEADHRADERYAVRRHRGRIQLSGVLTALAQVLTVGIAIAALILSLAPHW